MKNSFGIKILLIMIRTLAISSYVAKVDTSFKL